MKTGGEFRPKNSPPSRHVVLLYGGDFFERTHATKVRERYLTLTTTLLACIALPVER